jgi:hypothetical protein
VTTNQSLYLWKPSLWNPSLWNPSLWNPLPFPSKGFVN